MHQCAYPKPALRPISRSIVAVEILDIFTRTAEKPGISILSERRLAEVAQVPQEKLSPEALRAPLNDGVKQRSTCNAIEVMR